MNTGIEIGIPGIDGSLHCYLLEKETALIEIYNGFDDGTAFLINENNFHRLFSEDNLEGEPITEEPGIIFIDDKKFGFIRNDFKNHFLNDYKKFFRMGRLE